MDATEYLGNSKWLRAPDLKGRRVVVYISECSNATFKDPNGSDKKQIVLHFHGTDKLLGLNVTSTRTVFKLYGPDTNSWIGKAVALYPTTTEYQGKTVDCIRIETQVPVKQIEAEARPIANGSQAAPRRMAAMEQRPLQGQWKTSTGPAPVMPPADLPADDIPF
jgi:hypothetical protein